MMAVHPYQADPKFKQIRMSCRACVQLLLDVDEIDASINNQILKTPHDLLFHLAALGNGRNPEIGTLKKEKGDIFSEICTESFKAKFLWCVNEFLSEMIKKSLKDTHLGTTTPTELQNEVATCWKVYYEKDNQVMINQLVNEFYTCFLFKIDALPQEVGFLLDTATAFFNNLSPDVR